MRTPDTAYLSSALAATEMPCVSIYLPTHRAYPDKQQDSIRFRNVVDEVESTLSKSYPVRATRDVTDRLRAIEREPNFWDGAQETLIVLASPARCDAFAVPRKFPERVEVGATFHIKPLLRHVQSADRFYVLGLSRERAALFHGNRYELAPLDVAGVPLTMAETLGTETFEPIHQRHANRESVQSASIQHVEGARKQDVIPDVERFFRTVDRAVTRLVCEPTALPLIPAGAEENLSLFRAITKNRHLTKESVHGDWTNWNLHEIREAAWKVFEKGYLELLASIREDYGTAAARARATAQVDEAAKAAAVGRIGILLIDADRTIPGAIDIKSGDLRKPAALDGHASDMLDDLAEMALKTGARVIVTPSANMPTDTGLAAILRY